MLVRLLQIRSHEERNYFLHHILGVANVQLCHSHLAFAKTILMIFLLLEKKPYLCTINL